MSDYGIVKYCVNCEEQIPPELLKHSEDFCSPACKSEYEQKADPVIVARSSNTNPDALPILDIPYSPRANGILPSNTIEAISSLLQTSSKQSIADAVKIITDKKPPE